MTEAAIWNVSGCSTCMTVRALTHISPLPKKDKVTADSIFIAEFDARFFQ